MADSVGPCSCDSGKKYADCCGPLLAGEIATSPEALMRSRYTAFCQKNIEYLEQTTDPQARMENDWKATRIWAEESTFTKLEILATSEEKNKGTVEFKAHFTTKGESQVHHEFSTFRKQAGVWFFRNGRSVRGGN